MQELVTSFFCPPPSVDWSDLNDNPPDSWDKISSNAEISGAGAMLLALSLFTWASDLIDSAFGDWPSRPL